MDFNSIQKLVEMYGKFGEKEDKFIEEIVIDNMNPYIKEICKHYRRAYYYEDMKQDLIIFLIQCIKKNNIFLFKKHLVSRIMRSRNRHRNSIHIPEHNRKQSFEYITMNKSKFTDSHINIYELLSDNYSLEDDIINRIFIRSFATNKELEVIDLRNIGYKDVEISELLNISTGACNIRMNKLKQRKKNKCKGEKI